jgi:hypothetical protein
MPTSAPSKPPMTVTTASGKKQTLPDEQFWQRYSPHFEAPLSGVGSFTIHVLVIGVLAIMGLLILPLFNKDFGQAMDDVAFDPNLTGGGGGDPRGVGDNPGDGASGQSDEQNPPDPNKKYGEERVPTPNLPIQTGPSQLFPDLKDQDISRLIDLSNQAVESTSRIPKTTFEEMRKGLASGKGKGGSGSSGGEGSGKGKGTGSGEGEGKGQVTNNKRIQRMLRWTMAFNTRDGADYARQLKALGAIIAVESPEDPTKGMVYRELVNPAPGQLEDLREIKRIWWIDDKPDSVFALCRALSIQPTPRRIVAFLPVELEDRLLQLELNYKGRNEEDIKETVFEIRVGASGRYEPHVLRQR